MDDRMDGVTHQGQREPLTRAQRLNMTLRWLGILLPLAMTYGLGLCMAFSRGSRGGFLVALGLAALFWICCAAALLRRRDRGGAAAITVVYLFADAWWILVAVGAAPAD